MPTPLIQGCINPIMKSQLILAIDEGCRGTDMSDPICTVFKSQLSSMPPCAQPSPNPMYDQEPTPSPPPKKKRKDPGPLPLTPYQKHVSACLKEVKDFDRCKEMWKAGQSMEAQYTGSGYTKTKIRSRPAPVEPAPSKEVAYSVSGKTKIRW